MMKRYTVTITTRPTRAFPGTPYRESTWVQHAPDLTTLRDTVLCIVESFGLEYGFLNITWDTVPLTPETNRLQLAEAE